jgi:beta-N-acetylhexosaminidase
VVGSRAHEDLARRIAEASVTLVRDDSNLLPIGRGDGDRPRRVIVIAPNPVDLTPAETDSYLRLTLGDALRGRGLDATELVAPLDPTDAQAAALAFAAGVGDGSDGERSLVIVGTWDAVSHPGQLRILDAVVARGAPAVLAVALRSPYDVGAFPRSVAAACTYGMQPPQLEALAAAIVGEIPFRGRLPVALEASVGLEGSVAPDGWPDVERREPGREATGAPR